MSDDFFDGLWKSFRDGWESGAKGGPSGTAVRSRPSFWNPFHTWRDEEKRELRSLYEQINTLFSKSSFMDVEILKDIAGMVAGNAIERTEHADAINITDTVSDAVLHLIGEEFFSFPQYDQEFWSKPVGFEEGVPLKHFLERKRRLFENTDALFGTACSTIETIFAEIVHALPTTPMPVSTSGTHAGTLNFSVMLVDVIHDPAAAIERAIRSIFDKSIVDADLFHDLRGQLHHNLLVASGIDPRDKKAWSRTIMMPTDSRTKKTAQELVDTYLAYTPFHDFFAASIPFVVPQQSRVEHCHIIGGTGHGKTQLLQQLVLYDLHAAHIEPTSIVIIDSQGDLIRKLSALSLFDPNDHGSLAERFILIDPSDIECPPALNLFDPGIKRLEGYSPRERELAFNSLVDIYGRFFGALLGAELTARQGTVFRYLARLMLTIESATIHTLIALMDDVGPFKTNIENLDPTARRFFEKEFTRPAFNATRQQIKQRLYAVLSIPTFDRLFSAPRSKFNFFDALNEGSIVLVNTAKDLLKPDGTAIFGRFILSLIEHAIMERATLPEAERTPTYLYVDEAQDYFDETIETLLVQGRKFNFGLILAHQNLAQLDTRLKAILMGNTSIKLAGGVTDNDAKALAPDMRTTKEHLLSMRKQDDSSEFALSVRNLIPHALTVMVPFGQLESEPSLSDEQQLTLLEQNRARVCYSTNTTPELDGKEHEENVSKTDVRNHLETQYRLATLSKDHGFGAEIEYILPDGKRIDLALFGHSLSIAIEISVTNREAYELGNIEKALDADFSQVWMLADDVAHRESIAALTRKTLTPARLTRVTFGQCDDAEKWLVGFSPMAFATDTVAGYEVISQSVPPASPVDHDFRRNRIRYALGRYSNERG